MRRHTTPRRPAAPYPAHYNALDERYAPTPAGLVWWAGATATVRLPGA
jgi:hypothetical protein